MNTPEQIDRNRKMLDDIKEKLSTMDATDIRKKIASLDFGEYQQDKLDTNLLVRFYCQRELNRRELAAMSN